MLLLLVYVAGAALALLSELCCLLLTLKRQVLQASVALDDLPTNCIVCLQDQGPLVIDCIIIHHHVRSNERPLRVLLLLLLHLLLHLKFLRLIAALRIILCQLLRRTTLLLSVYSAIDSLRTLFQSLI